MVYATCGLIESLLRQAQDREPAAVTISLDTTASGEFSDVDVPPETPVFTHFYLPSAGSSVNAVFGVDLGTPVAQTAGRFVSHPQGDLSISKRDDLHAVVFVAIPPWDRDSIAVFDRHGTEQPLRIIDAEPPEEQMSR